MSDCSDDEVQLHDADMADDAEAQLMGEAQAFDAVTGMPVPSSADMDDDLGVHSDAAAARRAALDEVAGVSSSPSSVETWQLTLAEKNQSNTQDIKVPHMLGIDEAGRGPVLGSMVYGICWCPVSKLEELKNIKVADSKTLTFAQRQGLFRNIQQCPWLGYEVDVISADRLSREMMRRQRINLNAISHDSAISLIQSVLNYGVNVREIYVDTVGDSQKYQEKIEAMFPGIAVTVAKKADSLFPVVSAASIAAKVTRDLNLEQWRFAEEHPRPNGAHTPYRSMDAHALRCSRQLGSGYPGDPLTKVWMQNHMDPVFGYPGLVRFSWGTTKKILKAQAVQAEWGDEDDEADGEDGEDEEGGGGKGAQKMDKFFAKDPASVAAAAASAAAKAAAASAAASTAAPALVTGHSNNKRFSSLHDSVTRKQHALPYTQRIGFFQRHRMDLATTF